MAKIVYPLLKVLVVKRKRVEDQERVVFEKKEALEKEEAKLKERKLTGIRQKHITLRSYNNFEMS